MSACALRRHTYRIGLDLLRHLGLVRGAITVVLGPWHKAKKKQGE